MGLLYATYASLMTFERPSALVFAAGCRSCGSKSKLCAIISGSFTSCVSETCGKSVWFQGPAVSDVIVTGFSGRAAAESVANSKKSASRSAANIL